MIPNIGSVHWGLGIWGFSVNSAEASIGGLCQRSQMFAEQLTPCGMIPDSGTTFIMGPSAGIKKLYAQICDGWPRCYSLVQEKSHGYATDETLKVTTFQQLLTQ